MGRKRVGIIDILGKSASKTIFSRYSRANNMSVMPQAAAVWAEEMGHEVHFACYSGPELFIGHLPENLDILFINAFTQNALLAYAIGNYYRAKGVVTVMVGPHARSYPLDSIKYFDYAVGFCDKTLMADLIQDASFQRPIGLHLTAARHPERLPGARERWKYIELMATKSPMLKLIPILGSLGCPYTCSFCTDATVPYQPLDFDDLKEDLRFIVENRFERSLVVWHDPNFGIRFNEYLDVIEEAVPKGSVPFIAETSLALLKEANVKRLAENGFKTILPGIESWFDVGDKSRMRKVNGMEKVRRVAEHAQMITSYLPYMQANLILGLDADEGEEPYELTKRFVDLAPQVYPFFSLLTSFGRSAPDNLEYQRQGRVLNMPFHFLNQIDATNVRPKNYSWDEYFGLAADVMGYAFSPKALAKRFTAKIPVPGLYTRLTRMEMLLRGYTSERNHKYKYLLWMKEQVKDPVVRRYLDGETTEIPPVFADWIERDLGPFWEWLPEGAMYHNPNAYLESTSGQAQVVSAGMSLA